MAQGRRIVRFLPFIISGVILVLVNVFWDDITKRVTRPDPSPEALERAIGDSDDKAVWDLIRQRAPEDYDALLQELSQRLNDAGNRDTAFTAGVTVMQDYVKRLSAHAQKADDAGVRAHFRRYHDLLTAMPKENLECGKFVFGGALLVGRAAMLKYMDRISPMAVANVALLLDARDSERTPTPGPTEADYAAFIDRLRARGVTDQDFALLDKGDWKNPAYCALSRSMADLLATMEGDAAHKVRISFYKMVNAQQ